MAYETILYEKQHGVATITLNRPQSLNAFVPQMNKEVLEALKDTATFKNLSSSDNNIAVLAGLPAGTDES